MGTRRNNRFHVFLYNDLCTGTTTFLPPLIFRTIPRRSLSAEITIIVCTIARILSREMSIRAKPALDSAFYLCFFSCKNLILSKSHKFGRFTCHDSVHVAAATSVYIAAIHTHRCVLTARRRNKNDRLEQSHLLIFLEGRIRNLGYFRGL